MAAMRRRNLVSSRRRVEDEGEEDDGPLSPGDDSASDASILTDAEDILEVDDSELSDNGEISSPELAQRRVDAEKVVEAINKDAHTSTEKTTQLQDESSEKASEPAFVNTADTDAMLHGLKPPDELVDEEEDLTFDESATNAAPIAPVETETLETQKDVGPPKRESMVQRRIRESQEYNTKRDSDPAFVPTRGGFFMHDHRNDAFTQGASMAFGRGRGRGRDVMSNPHLPFRPNNQPSDPSKGRWDHDLHDAITNVKPVPEQKQPPRQEINAERPLLQATVAPINCPSKSVPVGAVMVKVSLPSTNRAAKTVKMTVHQHTRLPDLRPPLRRDKPVRISLPDLGPRYIFPSTDRSFVFIPRAQRPNQQPPKTKGRSFANQPGSRRTSGYGDSGYEPSVSMSRRSSVARDTFVAPNPPVIVRQMQPPMAGPARPVVKLPSGSVQESGLVSLADQAVSSTASEPYDLPSQPTYRENTTSQLTMHQPRPQKTVSVATIESPDHVPLHAPQQQVQQPFHHQVPVHINGQMSSELMGGMHGAHLSVGPAPGARSMSTTNILEGAINAQPFQPSTMGAQAVYAASYPAQSLYYYPTQSDVQQDPYNADSVASPVYVQQGPYLVPMFVPPSIPSDEAAASAQLGTYAQERNGMVYYYDSSQLMSGPEEAVPATYTVSGGGGMLPPGPDGYYYTPTPTNVVYYPT